MTGLSEPPANHLLFIFQYLDPLLQTILVALLSASESLSRETIRFSPAQSQSFFPYTSASAT
jgi:hypothetical protein